MYITESMILRSKFEKSLTEYSQTFSEGLLRKIIDYTVSMILRSIPSENLWYNTELLNA